MPLCVSSAYNFAYKYFNNKDSEAHGQKQRIRYLIEIIEYFSLSILFSLVYKTDAIGSIPHFIYLDV